MHIYAHTHTYTYIHTHIHIHTRTHTHKHAHVHSRTHTHTHTVSDRRGQPTIRDVDLEMVVKRIAGAVVYVFNLTRFIFFPGWNFTKVRISTKQSFNIKMQCYRDRQLLAAGKLSFYLHS